LTAKKRGASLGLLVSSVMSLRQQLLLSLFPEHHVLFA
jgi:hypothetical protein